MGSSTKATWKDKICKEGIKTLMCEEFQEAMGGANSKEVPKVKLFYFFELGER
jgi:hypothetical protein